MKATFLVLRKRWKEIVKALDRNQSVTLFYRGKAKGVIVPASIPAEKVVMEEFGPSSGLRVADALIAATAAENHLRLCTGDNRHFRPIRDLDIAVFRPYLLTLLGGRGVRHFLQPDKQFRLPDFLRNG